MSVNKKYIKSTITTCTTLRNNYVRLTSSKCRFHEKILHLSSSLWKNGWLDLDAVWSDGSAGSEDEAARRDWRLPC